MSRIAGIDLKTEVAMHSTILRAFPFFHLSCKSFDQTLHDHNLNKSITCKHKSNTFKHSTSLNQEGMQWKASLQTFAWNH